MSEAQGLPCNIDAEKFVLGSILLDDVTFPDSGLSLDLFSAERHKRIARRMGDLRARGERIDTLTLCNEMQKAGEFETGTASYLASLYDGMPQVPRVDSYVRILEDKAARRRIIFASEHLKNRCAIASEDLGDIIAAGQELFSGMNARQETAYQSVDDLPLLADCGATEIEFLRDPELPRGAVVALTGDSGCGKSTLVTAWARDLWKGAGVPTLFLDRENPLGVIADRMERLGIEDGPGIRWWGGWLKTEAPQPDDPIIQTWAKERAGLVVVDSFSAFGVLDQNDASETRAFMHRCRRLADLGATVVVIHHSGKGESSADYRGSSDFKAAIDQGFHVSNFGADGRLDKLIVRSFKTRIGSGGETSYEYAGGAFTRGDVAEARETVNEQLIAVLRQNPGVNGKRFEELATAQSISRSQFRTFLLDGLRSGAIQQRVGSKNAKTYCLKGSEDQFAL